MKNDELLGVFRLPVNMTGDIHEYLVVRQFYCNKLELTHTKMCLCMRLAAQQGLGPDKIPFMQMCNCDQMFEPSRRPIIGGSIQIHESE